jgi:hypothetical protein
VSVAKPGCKGNGLLPPLDRSCLLPPLNPVKCCSSFALLPGTTTPRKPPLTAPAVAIPPSTGRNSFSQPGEELGSPLVVKTLIPEPQFLLLENGMATGRAHTCYALAPHQTPHKPMAAPPPFSITQHLQTGGKTKAQRGQAAFLWPHCWPGEEPDSD